MKKTKQLILIFVIAFSILVIFPLIAWLLIQFAINLGNIVELYVNFLSRFFIQGVDELIAIFSIVFFLLFLILFTIIWAKGDI